MSELFQKLEEKVMILVTELEGLRKEVHSLRSENTELKTEKVDYAKKLQNLISLLDVIETEEQQNSQPAHDYQPRKEEYAISF